MQTENASSESEPDHQAVYPSQTSSFHWLTASDVKTWLDERNACALVASIRKNGEATHGNLSAPGR
jgi:hypothetical protein